MNAWRAIVPFRAAAATGAGAKTRLADRLGARARAALAEAMAEHVLETLLHCPLVGSTTVLAPARPAFASGGTEWTVDRGRGLNLELAAVLDALQGAQVLIIHADLPQLDAGDIAALLDAAASAGAAIAPDHARTGTNALALSRPAGLVPAFGTDSFALHRALLPGAAVIERPGLAFDIDTPADLDHALAAGLFPGLKG